MKAQHSKKLKIQDNRPFLYAAITACIVMLATGIGYRVELKRLVDPNQPTITLSDEDLARLPMDLGDWKGEPKNLDPKIIEATDTDAIVSRLYTKSNGFGSVWFYIAYGVRARDLEPHRPEVCYRGAGWTRIDSQTTELSLSDGSKLPCNVMQFSRGILNQDIVIVLYYYIVDGEYSHDVSLLRKRAWSGSGKVGYVAQVQIVASANVNMKLDLIAKSIHEFAVISASSVLRLFEKNKYGNRDVIENTGS